jgi:hypothetical protein
MAAFKVGKTFLQKPLRKDLRAFVKVVGGNEIYNFCIHCSVHFSSNFWRKTRSNRRWLANWWSGRCPGALEHRRPDTWPASLGVWTRVVPRDLAPRRIGVRPRRALRPHSSPGRTAWIHRSVRVLSLGTRACRGRHRTGGVMAWEVDMAEAWGRAPSPDAYLSGRRPFLAGERTTTPSTGPPPCSMGGRRRNRSHAPPLCLPSPPPPLCTHAWALSAPARSRRHPNSLERSLQRWPPPGAAARPTGSPSTLFKLANRSQVSSPSSPHPFPANSFTGVTGIWPPRAAGHGQGPHCNGLNLFRGLSAKPQLQ